MDMQYCPKCATRLEWRSAGDRERPTCPACDFVFYFNPVVGAGALVESDGRVVLVRRGVAPKAGYWSLPSGYVEADELAEEAAVERDAGVMEYWSVGVLVIEQPITPFFQYSK